LYILAMASSTGLPIHAEVLSAALRICRERGGWTFRAEEIVRALPHLNARSVRTHIVSRCCVNAPRNHPHKWDYFRRVRRGEYEIVPARRIRRDAAPAAAGRPPARREAATRVSEHDSTYAVERPAAPPTAQRTIHAVVRRDRDWYVGSCLEVAVVTQGRTLDELVSNLREAVSLHIEGEDLRALGLTPRPWISIAYEFA
jgi:predicted RNase H-like HicB family nuclease